MSFFAENPGTPQPAVAARLQELYGFVPRVFRLLDTVPAVVEKQAVLLEALLIHEDFLSRTQKEQILLTVAVERRSSSGAALHAQMLRLLGLREQEIARIAEGGSPDGADGELVTFTRRLVSHPLQYREAQLERLRTSGFTEAQIVEAIVLIGVSEFLNTLWTGTGGTPDFPVPRLSAHQSAPADNNVYPDVQEFHPIVEAVEDDPDTAYVRRAQGGELGAFETLVERHSQRIYRTLVGLLGNTEDAKDALQDTFLKAFQNLSRFEGRAKFSTWLISIASNTGLQQLRDRKQLDSLDEDSSDHEEFRPRQVRAWGDDPEQACSAAQRRELVERAIAKLPAKYRVVLMLRDVQQLSTEEAAAALNLGVPALKARLLRGRLMLRENLALISR
jgi:RNA polymerase sigma-70 factor (ECF subfamily)